MVCDFKLKRTAVTGLVFPDEIEFDEWVLDYGISGRQNQETIETNGFNPLHL